MDEKEIAIVTKDVILSSVYYRLLVSRKIIEEEISKRQVVNTKKTPNFLTKAVDKVSKYISDNEINSLQEDLKKLDATIEKFKEENKDGDSIYEYAENIEEFKKVINDLLANDKDNKLRFQVALLSALESEKWKHKYSEKTLESLSILIFNDKKVIKQLVKKYNGYLAALKFDAHALRTAAVAMIFALVVASIAVSFGVHASANVGQVLCNLGHAATGHYFRGAMLVVGSASMLSFFATWAASYTVDKDAFRNINEYREALKKMDKGEFISGYAIQLTVLDAITANASEESLKECKDTLLQNLSTAREELEYLFVIENDKEKTLKTKISVCNNVVDCLSKLVKKTSK